MVSKADEKWDAVGDNPLVIVSELRMIMEEREQWQTEIDEFIGDPEVTETLDMIARMIGGDIPEQAKVARVMVRLEAINIKFRTQFSVYMGFKKGTTEANAKKNFYKEYYTGIDRLVDSLKYLVR